MALNKSAGITVIERNVPAPAVSGHEHVTDLIEALAEIKELHLDVRDIFKNAGIETKTLADRFNAYGHTIEAAYAEYTK